MNVTAASARAVSSRPVVLIVDDEPDLLELVSLTLGRMNLETRTAPDVGTARRLLKGEKFDLCLTDMRLPDGDGLDLVAWIQENRSDLPVAVITAHGNVESAVRALKLGAFDFVSKPLDLGVLRKLVGSAIRLGGADRFRHGQHPRPELDRQLGRNGAAARNDCPGRAQPGAGTHLWRIGHRQGVGRAAGTCQRLA
jgi:two-component system response regulator PilR (NtrC family)